MCFLSGCPLWCLRVPGLCWSALFLLGLLPASAFSLLAGFLPALRGVARPFRVSPPGWFVPVACGSVGGFVAWVFLPGFAALVSLSLLRLAGWGAGWSVAPAPRPRLSLWWCAVSSPSPSLLCAPLGAAVAFGGSRSLPPAFSGLVASVVSAVLASGASVRVGCAVGADAAVLSSAVASGPPSAVSVFAFFGPGGVGAWSGSAVSAVLAAAAAGAPVSWWAGGSPSSGVPFRARLAVRSRVCVSGSFAAAFFLASPSSPGSLGAAAAAVRSGAFVFAFACGFSGPPVPLFGVPAGSWVPAVFFGFACWLWVPVVGSPWSPAPAPVSRQLSLFS